MKNLSIKEFFQIIRLMKHSFFQMNSPRSMILSLFHFVIIRSSPVVHLAFGLAISQAVKLFMTLNIELIVRNQTIILRGLVQFYFHEFFNNKKERKRKEFDFIISYYFCRVKRDWILLFFVLLCLNFMLKFLAEQNKNRIYKYNNKKRT